ncbi:ComF family protein [Ottowia sp.]|uniref:ComF family protein n=1 Tax=Ottowia sp. TaxID=1898956 RepID=UPI0039E2429F
MLSRTDWPGQCLICRAWPAATLCPRCVARFGAPVPRCENCALPVPAGVARCGACLREPPPFDRCLVAARYGWPWARCIGQFKFRGDPGLAAPLAAMLAAAPGVAQALAEADLVLPVPLSAERLSERGYNPAQLLAQALAPGRMRTGLLLRPRHAPPQHGLPRAERLKNVRGAYAVDPPKAPLLHGRRVALVDDVMTTGASLREAARALRDAGVAHVTALAFARTDES